MVKPISILDKDYSQWLKDLSSRYRRSQIKANRDNHSNTLHYINNQQTKFTPQVGEQFIIGIENYFLPKLVAYIRPAGAEAIIIEHRPLSRPAGAKPHPTLGNAHCSHNTPAPALKGQKRLTSGITPKGQKLSPSGTARCLALKGQKQNHASSNNSFLSI
ncbi:MAG: hypothetical protein J6S84_07070 [Bacteroidales bacterium]|jgi:hypothetical protein|nr:hypothetical protein [Bacteroidales bacterium]MBO7652454.1 hypothetical protein [Bacteroidales bacterium]